MKKETYLKQQAKKLTHGQIDRRQFIMGALAAGVALPSALSMAGDAIAATPQKGGHLKLGLGHGSTTDSLDPATAENGFQTMTGFGYGNCLTEVAAAFIELEPGRQTSEEELIGFCKGKIAGFKIPRHVRFIEEWPISSTKIQKFRLQDQIQEELGL